MSKVLNHTLLGLAFVFLGCSPEKETPAKTTLRLDQVQGLVDGEPVMQVFLSGFQVPLAGDTYTYQEDGAELTGTWMLNDDQTVLTVAFASETLNFPVLHHSESEIQFESARWVVGTSLTPAMQHVAVFTNQKLLATGNGAFEQGATLQLISTLKLQ